MTPTNFPTARDRQHTRDQSPAQIRDRETIMLGLTVEHHAAVRRGVLAWMARDREILKGVL